MDKEYIKVDVLVWHRVKDMLIDGRENAQELLNEYLEPEGYVGCYTLGKTAKSYIKTYKTQIKFINDLLKDIEKQEDGKIEALKKYVNDKAAEGAAKVRVAEALDKSQKNAKETMDNLSNTFKSSDR